MSHGLKRARFVALAAALPAAARAQSETPTLRVGAGLDVESTPLLYAQKAGLFTRAGLDVEVLKIPGGGTGIAAAVAGGGLDLGKASTLALIAAHARGIPFVLLVPAAYYSSDHPDIPLVVAAASPLRTPRDLDGTTIAVVSLATTMRLAIQAWIDQNGGDSASVHFVELSPTAVPAAIGAGRITGGTIADPVLSAALSTGQIRILGYPYNALGKHFDLADWFSTSGWVAKNREVAATFARVMLEANRYVAAHESEMTPLIASYVGIDESVLAKMRNPERGTYYEPSLIQPIIDAAARYKMIPSPFPVSELISDVAVRPGK